MSTSEIKVEIQKVLDNIPESILKDILSYLKELQGKDKSHVENVTHLRQILEEDTELLKKLAL
ncbi:MAG: hypothetical protein NTX03_14835 [Bacteroidetes bacterium]|nr:hypothetical protein [Bacteroidota bacterium]